MDGGSQVRNRLGLGAVGRAFLFLRACILLRLYLGCLHLVSDREQLVRQVGKLSDHILLAGTQLFHGNGVGTQDVGHIVGGVPRLVVKSVQGELLVIATLGDNGFHLGQGLLMGLG